MPIMAVNTISVLTALAQLEEGGEALGGGQGGDGDGVHCFIRSRNI